MSYHRLPRRWVRLIRDFRFSLGEANVQRKIREIAKIRCFQLQLERQRLFWYHIKIIIAVHYDYMNSFPYSHKRYKKSYRVCVVTSPSLFQCLRILQRDEVKNQAWTLHCLSYPQSKTLALRQYSTDFLDSPGIPIQKQFSYSLRIFRHVGWGDRPNLMRLTLSYQVPGKASSNSDKGVMLSRRSDVLLRKIAETSCVRGRLSCCRVVMSRRVDGLSCCHAVILRPVDGLSCCHARNITSSRRTIVLSYRNIASSRRTIVLSCRNITSSRRTIVLSCRNTASSRRTIVLSCCNIASRRRTIVISSCGVELCGQTTVSCKHSYVFNRQTIKSSSSSFIFGIDTAPYYRNIHCQKIGWAHKHLRDAAFTLVWWYFRVLVCITFGLFHDQFWMFAVIRTHPVQKWWTPVTLYVTF